MEKMTFRQKLENLWYHNKVAIIVVPIFLIFIIIATIQIFTKDEPDANFLYMGPASIAFQGEGYLQESIATVMKEDYNKDGKKYIDYIELTSLDPDNAFDDETGDFATGYTSVDVQKAVGETFAAHIIAGDSMIYLLDEKYFNVAKDTGVLMPLSEALGYTPDFAINEYAVYLRDIDVYYMPGFNLLPDNTLLCIRYPVTLSNGKTEVEERERCNISVFRDMFSYKYDKKPQPPEEKKPENVTLEEFLVLVKEYAEKKKIEINTESISDITPDGFFDTVKANLFKGDNVTYLVYCDNIYVLGKHIGGSGVIDVDTCNFDNDEVNDVIFSYTYGASDKLSSSVSVFNLATLKETFLSLESPSPLLLEKNEKNQIDVYATDELEGDFTSSIIDFSSQGIRIASIYGDGKDILIKYIN